MEERKDIVQEIRAAVESVYQKRVAKKVAQEKAIEETQRIQLTEDSENRQAQHEANRRWPEAKKDISEFLRKINDRVFGGKGVIKGWVGQTITTEENDEGYTTGHNIGMDTETYNPGLAYTATRKWEEASLITNLITISVMGNLIGERKYHPGGRKMAEYPRLLTGVVLKGPRSHRWPKPKFLGVSSLGVDLDEHRYWTVWDKVRGKDSICPLIEQVSCFKEELAQKILSKIEEIS